MQITKPLTISSFYIIEYLTYINYQNSFELALTGLSWLLVKDGARSMEHGVRSTRKIEILHEKNIQILQTFYTFLLPTAGRQHTILVVVTRAQTSTELCIVVVSNQNLFRDVVNFMT